MNRLVFDSSALITAARFSVNGNLVLDAILANAQIGRL